jgi:hypothetical protein
MTTREVSTKRKALENLNSTKSSSKKKASAGVQRSKRGTAQNVDYDESKMYGRKEDFDGVMKVVREKEVVGEDEAVVETATIRAGGVVETGGVVQVRFCFLLLGCTCPSE